MTVTPAARAAGRLLADSLEDMARRLRAGQVPLWAINAVAPTVQRVRRIVMNVNREHACGAECGNEEVRP